MALCLFYFSSSCVRCMRSTRLWRKSWTGTRTIRASHLFTFLLNWPGWSPLKKIWNTSMVRTGERRLSFLQPLKDTATGSDRYVPWITCMFLSLLGGGQLTLLITPLPFFRLAKKTLNSCLPMLTPGIWVTCLGDRFLVGSLRSPWIWKMVMVCPSLPSLGCPAPTCSNSSIAAEWTVWSWQRRRGTVCWRRLSGPLSSTFR